jgi:phage terminase large subunit
MADGRGRAPATVVPYLPRAAFEPYHARVQRWAVMVCHRRAGKTVAAINDLILRALLCPRNKPRTAYIAPLHKQAKDAAWDCLKHYGLVIPGAEARETELSLELPKGGRVRLYGADNPDALRGIYLDEVVLDEYAQMRDGLWSEVIRPALADRQGGATFIGTPMGRNAFAQLWERAKGDPTWYALMLKASESGLLPEAELAAARQDMSADQYAQEFECSFDAAVMGAYYAPLIQQAEADKRIGRIPWEPKLPVHTAWDLGIGDSTVIWFFQLAGLEVRLIDYHENSGVGLSHYVSELLARKGRGWAFGEHILPHDAEVRELGTGKSRVEVLQEAGIHPRVLPAMPVEDGIQAVRALLPRCWFDGARCARGIEALRQYRCAYDDRLRAFRARPLHDWTSHAADGFRYLALGLPEPAAKLKPINYPKGVYA